MTSFKLILPKRFIEGGLTAKTLRMRRETTKLESWHGLVIVKVYRASILRNAYLAFFAVEIGLSDLPWAEPFARASC